MTLNDQPLEAVEEDLLQRAPFAGRVAALIKAREDPASLVVSINGAWGEGKSTVLRFIEHYLDDGEGIALARFNPWQFSSLAEMHVGFFAALAQAIGVATGKPSKKVARFVADYVSVLGPVSTAALGGDITKPVATLAKRFSETSIEETKQRINGALTEADARVVIFIDDLDRLEPDELRQLLKMVKLTADFDRTIYVLAYDHEFVARSVGRFFREDEPLRAGTDYLEKLVHLPLRLPVAEESRLREMCLSKLTQALQETDCTIADADEARFSEAFQFYVLPEIATPRAAKKLGDYVSAVLPMVKSEVNIADYLLLESMRLVFRSVYEDVRTHPTTYTASPLDLAMEDDGAAVAKKRIGNVLEKLPERSRERAERLLIQLFPRQAGVIGSDRPSWTQVSEPELRANKRIAVEAYLPKYFLYGVPHGEVSDAEADAFCVGASGATPDEISQELRRFLQDDLLVPLVDKLAECTLRTALAPAILIALAKVSNELPAKTREGFGLFAFTPIARAAWIAARGVGRGGSPEEHKALTETILGESSDLLFAHQFLRELTAQRSGVENGENALDPDQLAELGATLAEQVAEAAGSTAFWQVPLRVARLVPVVREYTDSVRSKQVWKQMLEEEPARSLGLLSVYFPSMEHSHRPLTQDIERAVNALDLEDLANACESVLSVEGVGRPPMIERFLGWWKNGRAKAAEHGTSDGDDG